jgi:thiosulfate/3-mercaptopyruvate sulfurtransferase
MNFHFHLDIYLWKGLIDSYKTVLHCRQHIPTAQHLDLTKCVHPTPTLPNNIPEKECFEEYVQSLGVNRDSHVVIYDRGTYFSSARAWWLFRMFGHDNVSVLDGGIGHYGLNAEATFSSGEEAPEAVRESKPS